MMLFYLQIYKTFLKVATKKISKSELADFHLIIHVAGMRIELMTSGL